MFSEWILREHAAFLLAPKRLADLVSSDPGSARYRRAAVTDLAAMPANEWQMHLLTHYPRLTRGEREEINRVIPGQGYLLINPLITTSVDSNYFSGIPLGPLASVKVYGRNLTGRYIGKSHAVGCKHHAEAAPDTDVMTLADYLATMYDRDRNLWRYDFDRCSKCGGLSCDRLTADQYAYFTLISVILANSKYGEPFPVNLDDLPTELASWVITESAVA